MALSEKDKKLIPWIVVLSAGLLAYGGYSLFLKSPVSTAVNIEEKIQQQRSNDQAGDDNTISMQALNDEPRPLSLAQKKPKKREPVEYVDLVDREGNPIEALIEPDPDAINTKRTLELSKEDKKIVSYLKSNLLLELEAKNNELKAMKNGGAYASAPAPVDRGRMPSGATPQNVSVVNARDLSGFSEMETTKPTFLGNGASDDEIDDAFRNVEVASISVGGNNAQDIKAYVRINGKLFKAVNGRKVGDYEIKETTPNYINVRYVPANVTRKIGHSGFAISD